MDTSSPTISPAPAMQYVDDVLADFRHWLRRACDECEIAVRQHPGQSLFAAFALGALTRRLPLPEMIVTGLRTALVAAPPALAVIGACALVEHCRNSSTNSQRAARPPRLPDRPDEFPLEGDGHTIIPGPLPPAPAPPAGAIT